MSDVTRRNFIKCSAGALAGVSAASLLASCSPSNGTEATTEEGVFPQTDIPGKVSMSEIECSVVEVDPISEFASEGTFDVVVVGAGASGVPAALSAVESGATVCVLQKESVVQTQGNLYTAMNPDESSEAAIARFLQNYQEQCRYRGDWNMRRLWADNSYDAQSWFFDHLSQFDDIKTMPMDMPASYDEGDIHLTGCTFLEGINGAMIHLAEVAADAGVEFFYSTPAVQLTTENGKVTGVVGKSDDGYVKVTANKGVILATGDYQNNDAMSQKYLPTACIFTRHQQNKTGDGMLLGMIAGAQMEDIPHTKMIHGQGFLQNQPYLALNNDGVRFTPENVPFESRGTIVLHQPDQAWNTIIDDNYDQQCIEWGGNPYAPGSEGSGSREQLEAFLSDDYVPDAVPTAKYFKADSIEELAEKMEIPVDAMKQSIERYNELCEQGVDLDFGKPSIYMKPVEKAPFYGLRRKFLFTAALGGLKINENSQCLDADGNVIDGLYAVGNCSGGFYGGIEYPMYGPGLSLSRCITFGRMAGAYCAQS